MIYYGTSTPRAAIAAAAVALTAITLGLFIPLPAALQPDGGPSEAQAANAARSVVAPRA